MHLHDSLYMTTHWNVTFVSTAAEWQPAFACSNKGDISLDSLSVLRLRFLAWFPMPRRSSRPQSLAESSSSTLLDKLCMLHNEAKVIAS